MKTLASGSDRCGLDDVKSTGRHVVKILSAHRKQAATILRSFRRHWCFADMNQSHQSIAAKACEATD